MDVVMGGDGSPASVGDEAIANPLASPVTASPQLASQHSLSQLSDVLAGPSCLYKLLSARHISNVRASSDIFFSTDHSLLLQPVFLWRNLSYLDARPRPDSRKRSRVKLDDLLANREEEDTFLYSPLFQKSLRIHIRGLVDSHFTDHVGSRAVSEVTCEVSLFELTPQNRTDVRPAARLIERFRRVIPVAPTRGSLDLTPVRSSPLVEFDASCFQGEMRFATSTPKSYMLTFLLHQKLDDDTLLPALHLRYPVLTAELTAYEVLGELLPGGDYELCLRPLPSAQHLEFVPSGMSRGPVRRVDPFGASRDGSDGTGSVDDPFGRCLRFHVAWAVSPPPPRRRGEGSGGQAGAVQPPAAAQAAADGANGAVGNGAELGGTGGDPPVVDDGKQYLFPLTSQRLTRLLMTATKLADDLTVMKKQRIEREEALHGAQVSVEYVFTSRNADNAEHETTLQRTCPTFQCLWCHLECGSISSLMTHLQTSHFRFRFELADEDVPQHGTAVVRVTLASSAHLEEYFVRTAIGRCVPLNFAYVARLDPYRGQSMTSLAQRVTRSRIFYHSRWYSPVRPGALRADSDDDADAAWILERSNHLIDEFSDVNTGEKEMMKLWNAHVASYEGVVIADRHVPGLVRAFATSHAPVLVQKKLRNNFALHLLNFYYYGVIGSDDIRACLAVVDEAATATVASAAEGDRGEGAVEK